jgi:hypothetical protein
MSDLYLHSPNTPSWRGAQLKNQGDNFTLGNMTWIGLAQNRDLWRVSVNTVMKLWVP